MPSASRALERWSNVPRIQPPAPGGARGATGLPPRCARGDRDRLRARRRAGGGGRSSTSRARGRAAGRAGWRSARWCSRPAATRARASFSRCSAGTQSSVARTARSGGSTWATSTARSPRSPSRVPPSTPGSTSSGTATAATSAAGRHRRRRSPASGTGCRTSPSGRWCRRSPTPGTARGPCRRSSSRSRWRRLGDG